MVASRERWSRALTTSLVALASAACVGQFVYQFAGDTGLSPASSAAAAAWCQIGFVPLKRVPVWYHVIRLLAPDVVVLASAIACKVVLRTADTAADTAALADQVSTRRNPAAKGWAQHARALDFVLLLTMLFVAGLSTPAVIPLVYVLCGAAILVPWSRMNAAAADFPIATSAMKRPLLPYTALHIVLVYTFQLSSVQRQIAGNDGRLAQTLGLPSIINGTAAEWYGWNVLDVSWCTYLHLASLVLLYFICARGASLHARHAWFPTRVRKRRRGQGSASATTPLLLLPLADRDDAETGDVQNRKANRLYAQAAEHLPHGCLGLITTWAVIFPSWLSFVLLLWANVHWLAPRRLYGWTVRYLCAYVFGLVLLDYLASIQHALPHGTDVYDVPTDSDAIAFLSLLCKTFALSVVALSCRIQNPTPTANPGVYEVGSTESEEEARRGGGPGQQKRAVCARAATSLRTVLSMLVSQAYLVAFIIVYASALDRVEILNAVYLIIITVFMSFPSVIAKGWPLLIVYCELAITLQYLWGFAQLKGALGGPNSTATLIIGLDEDSHSHLWQTLRWHLAILVLSLMQLGVMRSQAKRKSHSHGKRGTRGASHAGATAPAPEELAKDAKDAKASEGNDAGRSDGGGGTGQAAPARASQWRALGNYLLCKCWIVVLIGLVAAAQVDGNVSMISIGYVVLLFAILLMFQLRFYPLAKLMLYLALVYSAAVFIAKYLYQFEGISQTTTNTHEAHRFINASGLKLYAEEDQAGRFWYLFPSTLLFVACVIQIRLQHTRAPPTPAFAAIFNGPARYAKVAVQLLHRLLLLEGDVVVALVVFYACLSPRPDFTGIVTLAILLFGLCTSAVRASHIVLCVWIQVVVVAKLVYQLTSYWDSNTREQADVLEWIGLGVIDSGRGVSVLRNLTPLLLGLATILLHELAKVASPDGAWPRDIPANQRTLFAASEGSPWPAPLRGPLEVLATPFYFIGRQICMALLVCSAFVKLNAVGLVYLCLAGLGASDAGGNGVNVPWTTNACVRQAVRRYALWSFIVVLLLACQYASFVGLPPTVPYGQWAGLQYDADNWHRSLLRWASVPPLQPGTPGSQNATAAQIVVANAPRAWSTPSSIVVDALLVICIRLQLKTVRRAKAFWSANANANDTAGGQSQASTTFKPWHVAVVFFFKLIALLMVALAALSRRDIFCAGYIVFFGIMVFQVNLVNVETSLKWWARLRVYNNIILVVHALWVLPAVMITWETSNGIDSALRMTEAFGLRFGLDLTLRTGDPRISAWSFYGNGKRCLLGLCRRGARARVRWPVPVHCVLCVPRAVCCSSSSLWACARLPPCLALPTTCHALLPDDDNVRKVIRGGRGIAL